MRIYTWIMGKRHYYYQQQGIGRLAVSMACHFMGMTQSLANDRWHCTYKNASKCSFFTTLIIIISPSLTWLYEAFKSNLNTRLLSSCNHVYFLKHHERTNNYNNNHRNYHDQYKTHSKRNKQTAIRMYIYVCKYKIGNSIRLN